MSLRIVLAAVIVLLSNLAQAHGLIVGEKEAQLPVIVSMLLLGALWLAYCIGAQRVPPPTSRGLLFHGASLSAALITIDPMNVLVETGSAMHMLQHMLVLGVIAPLYVLARPLPQLLAASGRTFVRLWKPLLYLSRYPIWTSCLLGIAIWFWHAPKFYNLALASSWWHFIEHVCLALSAGVFWWSVLVRRAAATLPALLFTLIHTGILGALLTFAQTPMYDDSRNLQDQQLAGLIMWVPGALPFLFAGIFCSLRLVIRAS
jgi:putative membrane protein